MAAASSSASFDAWNNLQPAVMTLVMFWLLAGAIIRSLPLSLQGVLPYTVLVLLAGLLFGIFAANCPNSLGETFGTLTQASPYPGISPAMLQLSVLPPLIFADMFTTDVKLFVKTLGQTLLLAFPGVLMSAFLIAMCMVYLEPDHFTWPIAMMFGAMVSATDPVAVLVSMKELGCDKRLVTIVSGESAQRRLCSCDIHDALWGGLQRHDGIHGTDS
jgi:sodium/hydrogen exchanger 10/11